MKIYSFLLFWIGIILLGGCQSTQVDTMDLLDEKIRTIEISKTIETGVINDNVIATLEDQKSIKILEKTIRSAVQKNSNVNVKETLPDFNLIVNYKEGYPSHPIHVWLGEEGKESTLTYIFGEMDTYMTLPEQTNALRQLLLSIER
ncbi:hypothetical protein [Alkalihalobacterium chitinilyticum]|uniref:YhfM-like domain-containing protein n=1 Tax=Alkalihalobacterium chitinilyticum TaxID=2980103 RepID=A0ABT5VHY9_9BACI|nr:hypothetical protein [Alkalihalobacterium chitinilyticum]MDE5415072.1 hypothetical protein [Alkalihalobacterium chitinilyticum]